MRLLIVRHGETDLNKEMKAQGHVDMPLNGLGMRQAEETAQRLADTHIDIVISSPLKRAYDTACAIVRGRGIDIEVDERAMEQDLGDWEGEDWAGTGASNTLLYTKDTKPPNGESTKDFAQRVKGFINEISGKYRDTDKCILIVAHGIFSRAVEWAINGLTLDENGVEISVLVDNGEVVEYEL